MARTPVFATGTTTAGADPAADVLALVGTILTGHASGSWTLYDDVSSDIKVYKCVGDQTVHSTSGDTTFFLHLERLSTTTVEFECYQDWSTMSSTGSRGTANTGVNRVTLAAATAWDFWYGISEAEFYLAINQSGAWDTLIVGQPVRNHIPQGGRGTAFTTAQVVGSGGVISVPLDADISNDIVVGQLCWAVPLTPSGDALAGSTIEVSTVAAVTATSIDLTLSNTYETGSLIGLDPCAAYAGVATDSYRVTNQGDGASGVGVLTRFFVDSNLVESVNDPSLTGYHVGFTARLMDTVAVGSTDRGTLGLVSGWTTDTQDVTLNHFNRSDFSDSNRFWPLLGLNFPTTQTAWTVNLGPVSASEPAGTNFEGHYHPIIDLTPPTTFGTTTADVVEIGFYEESGIVPPPPAPAPTHPDATVDPVTGVALVNSCTAATDRLLNQFKAKQKINDLICIFADRATELDQEILNIKAFRSLTTALGQQLDNLGSTMGLQREGFGDDDYRRHLEAKALAIGSEGTINDLEAIMTKLDDGFSTTPLDLSEQFPGQVILSMDVTGSTAQAVFDLGLRFFKILVVAKAVGVRLLFEFQGTFTLFSWDVDAPAGDPAPPTNSGWEQNVPEGDVDPGGIWAEAL